MVGKNSKKVLAINPQIISRLVLQIKKRFQLETLRIKLSKDKSLGIKRSTDMCFYLFYKIALGLRADKFIYDFAVFDK